MTRYAHIVLFFHFLLTYILLFNAAIFPQKEELTFEHITTADGLPGDEIEALFIDSYGFIWAGTHNGLARYDGNEIFVYNQSDEDSTSIISNLIIDIAEDSNGDLWIGTYEGLSKYVRKSDNFINHKNLTDNENSLSDNLVTGIFNDSDGNLWISTARGGLNKLIKNEVRKNTQDIIFKRIETEDILHGIQTIMGICQDSSGYFWICSENGLIRFNPKIWDSKLFQAIPSAEYNPINNFLSPRVDNNLVWMTTRFNGLGCFNMSSEEFNFYLPKQKNSEYYSANKLTTILLFENNIWLGTWGGGVLLFDKNNKTFTQYQHNARDPQSLIYHESHISGMVADKNRTVWIAAYWGGLTKAVKEKNAFGRVWFGAGEKISSQDNSSISWGQIYNNHKGEILVSYDSELLKFDDNQKKFIRISPQPFEHLLLEEENVTDIVPGEENSYWVATNNGLKKINTFTGTTKIYKISESINQDYNYNEIDRNIKDSENNLWLDTRMFGWLVGFDTKTEKFSFYQYDSVNTWNLTNLPYFMAILALCEGSNNSIWILTNDSRVFNFNKRSKTFRQYLLKHGVGLYTGIFEDSKGRIWVSGRYGEVILLNKVTGEYKTLKVPTEFTTVYSQSFYEDGKGNIWRNHNTGLLKFDEQTLDCTSYDIVTGDDRLKNMYVCQKTGYLFTITRNNLYFFHPDSIRLNRNPPDIVFTEFYLFGKPIKVDVNSPLKENINLIDKLELDYWQNDFSIKFAGLHYVDPKKNQYKFMLENYDANWNYSDISRTANYTNMSSGEYTFRVIASNSNGIWNNEGASIKIIILPPWWATTWAYLLYALLTISLIYVVWKLQLKRVSNKHELEMTKFEAEKMHEVDELKSRFFANISHEFRTPLTLIFGPAKDVIEKTKESDTKKSVGIIKRNASRLYSLVNQLLDLSKLESGKMKLEASEQDIIPLLKGVFLSFTSFAERKKITLKFNATEENLKVYIDRDKVEKIINNLLSNAFKFTPEGGRIDFSVEKLVNDLEIKITDNGIGIPEERIDKIFDRFYQVDSSHTRQGEGTGIGLALTKELVELHKGKIKIKSKEGEGTTVSVQLPLGEDHLKPEEIVERQAEEIIPDTEELPELVVESENRKEKTDIDVLLDTEKPLLLIVEDNLDVRSYIISHLEEDYRIQEAIDGEDGLNQAIKHMPDLIISDVMMPKMDGFELCDKLKTDERTSHIPIIMLTAKATSKDKIVGYETGADDYIMKPFDASELKARIKNLIETRRKLQEKFSLDDFVFPKELSSIDEQFMKRVLNVINEHISEEGFSIEELGKEAGMSRWQIYKKITALTGKSPSLFIRSIRLAKAKKMIKEQKGTISEIAYAVGFSSPTYFSKCFREEFGASPSESQS